MDAFGGGDFVRLRLGVGRSLSDSENRSSVTDHVLGKFNNTEAIHLDRIIRRARDVVFTVLCQGVQEGMNKFNTKEPIISD
jgi:PTH1 family peptidyl-tRNA hydrolase